jgi:hypothetical protein
MNPGRLKCGPARAGEKSKNAVLPVVCGPPSSPAAFDIIGSEFGDCLAGSVTPGKSLSPRGVPGSASGALNTGVARVVEPVGRRRWAAVATRANKR